MEPTITNSERMEGRETIRMVCPRRLMDPERFLISLGGFPVSKAGDSVTALVDLGNMEMTWAVDMIAPESPISCRIQDTPWFPEELQMMKLLGRQCTSRESFRTNKLNTNQTRLRCYWSMEKLIGNCRVSLS